MDNIYATVEQLRNSYSEQALLLAASEILLGRIRQNPVKISGPTDVSEYFRLRLSNSSREKFAVMYLDNQHRLIEFEILFSGTINQITIYPREIIRRALELNSAAIIIGHNHPSGDNEPSWEDRKLTDNLIKLCNHLDLRVLDHLVVSHSGVRSFAQMGLI